MTKAIRLTSEELYKSRYDGGELYLWFDEGISTQQIELTATQFDAVARVLGLHAISGDPRRYLCLTDEQIQQNVLPVLEENEELFFRKPL